MYLPACAYIKYWLKNLILSLLLFAESIGGNIKWASGWALAGVAVASLGVWPEMIKVLFDFGLVLVGLWTIGCWTCGWMLDLWMLDLWMLDLWFDVELPDVRLVVWMFDTHLWTKVEHYVIFMLYVRCLWWTFHIYDIITVCDVYIVLYLMFEWVGLVNKRKQQHKKIGHFAECIYLGTWHSEHSQVHEKWLCRVFFP